MIFGGLKLSDITEEHLERFKRDQVQERDTVEYKSSMYGATDEQKREMLKDISSMANHRGGYIIIGIEENEEGIPTNIHGIKPGNHVERIRDSCLDNIDKRIVDLEIEDVPLHSGNVVVIVSVPESMNAPHMVTYKGLNQFWKRHGRQKERMTIDEVGEAFDKRLSDLNRLDRFLFTRKAEVLESIGDKTWMVISSSPAFLRDEIVFDVHDANLQRLILNPPQLIQGLGNISCGQPYPTIHGLRADQHTPYYSGDQFEIWNYLEVFRNGYIEYGKLFDREGDGPYFASQDDTASMVNFLRFVEKLYELYMPLRPVIITFTVYNAQGMWLPVSKESSHSDKLVRWQKQHLELGKFYAENLSNERKQLQKRIADRLWQAFNYWESNLFDDVGTFKIR